ncbi:rab effector noc2 [Limosa lapponica baueri]|uniref:Rab effector noc2 n=1 Tax=Limosa lapponica baueri TaxID=1758121 RepID=A0A2I0TWL7_LIMLA|nr:rab effector noc2 [Limosa lapponica baueri]
MDGCSPLPSLCLEDVLPHSQLQPIFILQAKWELSSGKDPACFAVLRLFCRDVGPSGIPAAPPQPGAMADTIFGSGTGQWVCPNDRQLALRAKLQTGWSVHTFQTEKQRKMQALSPQELEVILEVIRKAEKLDIIEQQRIGRLVERLENMRKNTMGNGLSQCLLCGELLGLLGSTSVFCQDCKKKVCTKCGIETFGAQKRPLWLCKICSEQREIRSGIAEQGLCAVVQAVPKLCSPYVLAERTEGAVSACASTGWVTVLAVCMLLKELVWKRSGAWFYKGLPKYITPLKSSSKSSELHSQPWLSEPAVQEAESVGTSRSFTWARGKVVSSDSESDSEFSSSSLDDKPLPAGSKGSQGRKHRAGLAPIGEPSQAMALGRTHSPALSGSHSSLGSEQGAALSATESCQSDQPADGRDSDVGSRVPEVCAVVFDQTACLASCPHILRLILCPSHPHCILDAAPKDGACGDEHIQAAPNPVAALYASHDVPTHCLATREVFSLDHTNEKQVAPPSELKY